MNAISICNTSIRQFNGLYSINDLHKAAGGEKRHQPSDWLRTQQTTDFIAECEITGNPVILKKQGFGTFVCKELVIHYAMWISPSFSLQVIRCFLDTVSGSLQPKPTKALPDGLTAEQIETVKKLHNALVKSAPKEQQAKIAITLWSAVKSKFGVSYKEVPAEQFAEVLSVMSRVAVDKGVLYGEVLEKQPAPSAPVLDDALLLAFARLLLHAQDMRLFVNRYLPAFQNLGIDNRGSLWSFVHDTEPTFAAVRRFMTAQSVQSGFFARDWDWVRNRILSTAQAF